MTGNDSSDSDIGKFQAIRTELLENSLGNLAIRKLTIAITIAIARYYEIMGRFSIQLLGKWKI